MSTELISNYRNVPEYRQAFFDFIPQVFPGGSFTEWHKRGCWEDDYQGHAIYDHQNKQMLANVSVGLMDIYIDGQLKRGVQFSSVGTLPQARKKGYSQQLIEHVLAKHADATDLFFLFANPSVTDFYPRFGFHQLQEHNFRADYPKDIQPNFSAIQLDVDKPADWQLITSFTTNRCPVTKVFGTTNEANVLNWSLLYTFRRKTWYLPQQQIIMVAETKEGVLYIYDILSKQSFSNIAFMQMLPLISLPNTHTIEFQFTPEKLAIDTYPVFADDNSPFFVRGDFLPKNTFFKFPVLART